MIQFSTFASQILPFTIKSEGGYANVTGDRGGETYRGISRKNWPNWEGWAIIDKKKPLAHNQIVPDMEQAVSRFYFDNFFVAKGFQYFKEPATALVFFDFAVNGGFSPKAFFDRFNAVFARKIPASSVFNAESLRLVNAANQEILKRLVMNLRAEHYASIIKSNPSQLKFKTGWSNRLVALEEAVGLGNKKSVIILAIAALILIVAAWFTFDGGVIW